jgi:hypothetical protein
MACCKIGGDSNMTYCETCQVNVKGRRLRECALYGHKLIWNYCKPDTPTISLTKREEEKLKRFDDLMNRIIRVLPEEKLMQIRAMAKELRKEVEEVLKRRGIENEIAEQKI